MGGDRTCPDDCPLAVWATLAPADRQRQRQSVAERLYGQGFTMEAIATQLGVSQQTISNDLGNLPSSGKLKPAKTASNPKGAGRPKGSGGTKRRPAKIEPAAASMAAALVLDGKRTLVQAAEEAGVGSVQVVKTAVAKEEGRRDPTVDRAALSQTAQQKLDGVIRRTRGFAQQHRLNIYKRAKLLNTLKWELRDSGHDDALIDEVVALLTPLLT